MTFSKKFGSLAFKVAVQTCSPTCFCSISPSNIPTDSAMSQIVFFGTYSKFHVFYFYTNQNNFYTNEGHDQTNLITSARGIALETKAFTLSVVCLWRDRIFSVNLHFQQLLYNGDWARLKFLWGYVDKCKIYCMKSIIYLFPRPLIVTWSNHDPYIFL